MRTLARLTSVGTLLVGCWLVFVVTLVLPRLHSRLVPFWTLATLGIFAYAALGLDALRRAAPARWSLGVLAMVSIAALVLGVAAITGNEVRAARGGDWEAWRSLLGIVLAVHGASMLGWLAWLAGRRSATNAPRTPR